MVVYICTKLENFIKLKRYHKPGHYILLRKSEYSFENFPHIRTYVHIRNLKIRSGYAQNKNYHKDARIKGIYANSNALTL